MTSAAVVLVILGSAARARAERIGLGAATTRALAQHPDLGIANAEIGVSDGHLLTAQTWVFNPEIAIAGGPVPAVDAAGRYTFVDYEASIAQTIELGGKRSHRVEVARAERAATIARAEWTRRVVELRVRRSYYLASIARARVQTAKDAQAAADEMKVATEERMRQHAGTQLEINVATADAGRAMRVRLDAERAYGAARLELNASIGARPEEDLEPDEEFTAPPELQISEDALVARTLAARPDLQAVRDDRDAAAADVTLEDAQAIPDVTLSLRYSHDREPGLTLNVFAVGLSIPLPMWNRNQGARAAARGTLRKAAITEKAVRWQAERDLRAAFRAYQKAREAVLAFDLDVIGKLDENLKLARDSFQSGKIGLFELNVVRRDLVETRFSYLDAEREALEALTELQTAAGSVEVVR